MLIYLNILQKTPVCQSQTSIFHDHVTNKCVRVYVCVCVSLLHWLWGCRLSRGPGSVGLSGCRCRFQCVYHRGRSEGHLRCSNPKRPPGCGRHTASGKKTLPQHSSCPARDKTTTLLFITLHVNRTFCCICS